MSVYLVYKPGTSQEQRWHYQPGRLKTAEMEAIEKRTGLAYGGEFKQKLLAGATAARKALLWTMLRRDLPTTRYEDLEFYDDELLLERDQDEIAAEIAALERFDGISDVDRELALSLLREQLESAPEPPGKAPSNSDDAPTG